MVSFDWLSLLSLFCGINLLYIALVALWERWSELASRLFVALTLGGAWWALAMALSYSSLAVAHPQLVTASQIASGAFGPLLFLFTRAYLGQVTRWSWRWLWLFLPALAGPVNFVLNALLIDEALFRAFVVEWTAGNTTGLDTILSEAPWFRPLQAIHIAELYVFFLASIYLFFRGARRGLGEPFELRLIGWVFVTMLVGVTAGNLVPTLGGSSKWPRAVILWLLPFSAALFFLLRRRAESARRLLRERAELVRYLPTKAIDQLMERGPGPHAERRRAAVLFCDIRGFTSLSEQVEPDALVQWLDRFFSRMSEAVLAEDGMVDKFIGDGLLAVFGAPAPMDAPGAAAVRAAERMLAELEQLNAEHPPAPGRSVQVGIGIHYGPILAGTVGGSARKSYTVFGDVVNTASRIEAATKEAGFAVLWTEPVHRQLDEAQRREATDLGPFTLRGKKTSVELFGMMPQSRDSTDHALPPRTTATQAARWR